MVNPVKAPLVPSVTGNPQWDSMIRNGIVAVSGAAAGTIVTWLNAHGFNDPNLSLMVSGAVAAVLSVVAGAAWSWWQSKQTQLAIVNNTVHAALTGEVPAAVAAKASPVQAAAIEASPTAMVK